MTSRRIVDHVLFVVHDLAASRRLFTATARGEPGVWKQYSDRYYAAFVNDLHDNSVEAVWHPPTPVFGCTRPRTRLVEERRVLIAAGARRS